MALSEVDKQAISDLLMAYGNVVAVYLHGSVIKGTMRDDSDIDIALLLAGGETLEAEELTRLH